MNGHGMIWPLADAYAREGWSVRRASWSAETGGDSGDALRWISFENSLFHLTFRESGTGDVVSRVVTSEDFGEDEFLASDWTVFSPGCEVSGAPGDWQGYEPYPESPSDSVNPGLLPNSAFGVCAVPPTLAPPVPTVPTVSTQAGFVPPTPPAPAGGGGGGGGGTGDDPRKRPRNPQGKPEAPELTLVIDSLEVAECHGTGPVTEEFSGAVVLAATADPRADGVYWWQVRVGRFVVQSGTMSPGDTVNFDPFSLAGEPGSEFTWTATAYLPARRLNARDTVVHPFKPFCSP